MYGRVAECAGCVCCEGGGECSVCVGRVAYIERREREY